jgi:8-oxo-dGTP diphosphatase
MESIYVNWGESRVKLTWNQDYFPPREFMTSAHGFCFFNEKLLLVDLENRGWDFPGGHLEAHEHPELAFKREAMEEGYVEGECQFLGAVEVDHQENPNWDETSPYPIVGYQMFYRMDITKLHNFEGKHESMQRILIDTSEVETYYKDWPSMYQTILEHSKQLVNK